MSSPRLIVWVALAGLLGSGVATVHAQPDVRDHRPERRPPPPPGPPGAGVPTEAPPAPREEKQAARAGFVWIPGRWEWHGKWDWAAGHWERERAGKRWREGRWEQKASKWVYAQGEWIDAGGATPPPPPGAGPTEAPPPPRVEKQAARAGFVWIDGQWDWKDNKWEWTAGHWERERAGKRWRALRWEQRDGRWARMEGGWEDATAATPPPPPPPTTPAPTPPPGTESAPPMPPRPHHEWRLDRPVVSSYWPAKGKAGSRIVIRGQNFPADAEVIFAGQPVKAAKISPDRIMFQVPAGAASGDIALKAGRGRPLAVGTFEVAAAFDPVAEQKKLEDERRKQAEAAWVARQHDLAKDRAARQAALEKARQEREASREQRRAQRMAEIQSRWQRAFLADPDTQDELTLHAQRIAELQRMSEMADLTANGKLAVRIQVAQQREDERHQQRMAALQASFQAKGGQP